MTGAATGIGFRIAILLIGRGLDVYANAWQVLDGFATTALTVATPVGGALGYLIPAMSLVRLPSGLLAWILDIAESLAAVPLRLIAHLGQGRDELVPPAYQGGRLRPLGLVPRSALTFLGLVL